MSQWFIIVLFIIFLASVVAILVRIEGRKETKRLEDGDLSADDFEIIE
jgi:cbb3-type cytochrome oxidase subunit 3